jgi:hypothetical protein
MSDEPIATGLKGVPLREQRSSSLRVPSHEGAVKPAAASAFVLFVRGSILARAVIAVWPASAASCSALIGASRARRSDTNSAISSRIGSFVSMAGGSRNPGMEISW